MNFKIGTILTFLCIILATSSCKDSNNYTPVKKSSIENKHFRTHKVVVQEIEEAGMYIYLKVKEDDKEYWIATSSAKLGIGKTYYFDGGTKMIDFKSKDLDKTFKEIIFVDALRSHEQKNPNMKTVQLIEQPEGCTAIKDILENSKSFLNKEIKVKGKVVKVNTGILERNWVHLRDGTKFDGKSNLTFTTLDTIKVGEIVTLKGTVILDKDFGHGYVYPILVEQGELVK